MSEFEANSIRKFVFHITMQDNLKGPKHDCCQKVGPEFVLAITSILGLRKMQIYSIFQWKSERAVMFSLAMRINNERC